MFCSHCGKEIADDSKFCEYCGSIQKITKPNERKKKPITRCLIIFIVVLMVIGGSIATIAGIQYHLKKVAEEELKEKERLEQEAKEKAWKEAYYNFLLAINDQDVDKIREEYPELTEAVEIFIENNFYTLCNSFQIDDSLPPTDKILFSLVYLDDDEIPELYIDGDYEGLLVRYDGEKLQSIRWKWDEGVCYNMTHESDERYYYVEKSGRIICDFPPLARATSVTVYQYVDGTSQKITDITYCFDGNLDAEEGYIDGTYVTNSEAFVKAEEYKKQVTTPIEATEEITEDNLKKVLGL